MRSLSPDGAGVLLIDSANCGTWPLGSGWVARVGLAEPRSEADTASRISQMRGPVQAGPLRYERVELPIRALVRRMELWQDERNEDGLLTRDVDLTVVLEVVAECVSAGREREETAVQHRGHRSSIH